MRPSDSRGSVLRDRSRRIVIAISTTEIASSTSVDPIVPNPRPPIAGVFVRRSPMVAPKGRVSTKAAQNNVVRESGVKKYARPMIAIAPAISSPVEHRLWGASRPTRSSMPAKNFGYGLKLSLAARDAVDELQGPQPSVQISTAARCVVPLR